MIAPWPATIRVVSDSDSNFGTCPTLPESEGCRRPYLPLAASKWAFELVTWVTATELKCAQKPGMRSRGDSPATARFLTVFRRGAERPVGGADGCDGTGSRPPWECARRLQSLNPATQRVPELHRSEVGRGGIGRGRTQGVSARED
jgi:hypothetical protein